MRIAVIGGGLTGLTAAYELSKNGHQVTVFEKEPVLGGLAHGFQPKNWEWPLEFAYHHYFTNDNVLIKLAREIGLGDKFHIARPITSTYYNGKINQLDSPLNLLKFNQIPFIDRIRTGALLAYCKVNPFWKPLEKITAEKFIQKYGGVAGWKTIWEPLLYGKFNYYADKVAASWFWARIKKRTTSLGYFLGGFQILINQMEKNIIKHGGIIYTDFEIESIIKSGKTGMFQIKPAGNNQQPARNASHSDAGGFDRVLLTTPTPVANKLVNIPKFYFLAPLAIPHLWAQTLILETDIPILDKIYWLNISDRSFPFLAVVAHTNFMDKSHYGGHHITYFGNYFPDNHPYLKMDKNELLKIFFPFIKKINPNLKSNIENLKSFLFTVPFAQPVHELNYSKRVPNMKTPVPGLFLANMDSIYPWDRGTNYAVELGQKVASLIN
jgi:protoporphyrinogen oxidase